MIELFDMGKYNFFVWSSVGIFLFALSVDFFSATSQRKAIKKQIKAAYRKATKGSESP